MAETASLKSSVKVADAGPSLKKLSIEIPADTVTAKLRESMDSLQNAAVLPGFRPGRAPRGLVEKRFGSAIRAETKSQLVSQALTEAVKEHKLQVVGEPVAPELAGVELKEGKALAFDVEVEVVPEFTLPALDGVEVKRPTFEITDQMADDEIQKIRINEGTLEGRDTPEAGDYLTGHGIMTGTDGTEFYNLQGAVVQIPAPDKNGKGMILGVSVEDFSKQFGLPKPGETATVKTTGPDNHEVEKIRGAKLTITFKVDRVDRIIPAPIDGVLKALGFTEEKQLKDALKTRLQQRVQVQQQVAMRQQLAKHLLSAVTMDLPKRLSSNQAARVLDRNRMELMYRGVEPQKVEEHIAELRAASANVAADELKLSFILGKAAETLNVRVTEAEINGRITQLAMENNVRADKLFSDLRNSNRLGLIFQQIREHKTLDTILAKAKVTDVPAAEFDKTNAKA